MLLKSLCIASRSLQVHRCLSICNYYALMMWTCKCLQTTHLMLLWPLLIFRLMTKCIQVTVTQHEPPPVRPQPSRILLQFVRPSVRISSLIAIKFVCGTFCDCSKSGIFYWRTQMRDFFYLRLLWPRYFVCSLTGVHFLVSILFVVFSVFLF